MGNKPRVPAPVERPASIVKQIRLTRSRCLGAITVLEDFAWRYDEAALLGLGLVQNARDARRLLENATTMANWYRRRLGMPDALPPAAYASNVPAATLDTLANRPQVEAITKGTP